MVMATYMVGLHDSTLGRMVSSDMQTSAITYSHLACVDILTTATVIS